MLFTLTFRSLTHHLRRRTFETNNERKIRKNKESLRNRSMVRARERGLWAGSDAGAEWEGEEGSGEKNLSLCTE